MEGSLPLYNARKDEGVRALVLAFNKAHVKVNTIQLIKLEETPPRAVNSAHLI